MYVFSFRVPLETSEYRISYGHERSAEQVITVGYSGSIFIDKETNMVVRLKFQADNIPAGFPVQAAFEQLDYDYQKIGDQEFLLPLVAEMRGKVDGKTMYRNTIEFRMYNRFSADAVIKFDEATHRLRPRWAMTERKRSRQSSTPGSNSARASGYNDVACPSASWSRGTPHSIVLSFPPSPAGFLRDEGLDATYDVLPAGGRSHIADP